MVSWFDSGRGTFPDGSVWGTGHHKSQENTQMSNEETQKVERTDVGVSITVELKRGTGTRDQDKVVGKLKASTLEDAEEDLPRFKEVLRETAEEARSMAQEEEEQ